MATLKDIAAACGISIATVSYVLSGRGDERRISQAMQQRVVQAAEELGYDVASRKKKSQETTIAVYWPQRRLNSMLPSFISGMNTALSAAPIPADAIIRPYEPGHLSEQSFLWAPGRIGASVIVSANEEDLETLKNRKTMYPAVLVNRTVPGYPSVSVDDDEASDLALEFVKQIAGDDMILVQPDSWIYGLKHRNRMVQQTCSRHHVKPKANYFCGIEIDDGYALGQKLLLEDALPKAILCAYDTMAVGIEQALRDGGLRLGADVELVTMSTSFSGSNTWLYRNMTVVDLRQTEVSVRAVNMAIELATHAIKDQRQMVVHPRLIPHR